MTNEQQPQDKDKYPAKLFTPDGKPVRVLSTSLGVALLANAFLLAGGVTADSASAAGESADEPKLVAWSTEEVKAYFDKNVDWNIPLPEEIEKEGEPQAGSSGGSGSGGTTVINNYGASHSGFGWDDLLLYHFLFNSGSSYQPSTYYDNRKTYYTGTSQSYKPRSYSSGTFQNKQVVGSTVTPKTSRSTGSITRRGTSSSSGGIGGKSSGYSSSGSSSKSSIFSGSRSSSRSGFGG
ncbi:hypothetical protein VQ056_05390 [Paenibacillus sp. JTLBN-2024]|jgi:hypothetical protein|uniref:DUF4247 domain-containing protein n=1 Tax=Paenibacillus cookii TaxID=157839 RepID=A0ABQ4LU60_9BACL|nr:hypothetical protein [Paenibacillus cookii]GIO66688.1 hypothetical protein J21TS3_15090 [Paenibacillus cookii]HWO52780.1 hypothetical protein [Paenibacillus cookii]